MKKGQPDLETSGTKNRGREKYKKAGWPQGGMQETGRAGKRKDYRVRVGGPRNVNEVITLLKGIVLGKIL